MPATRAPVSLTHLDKLDRGNIMVKFQVFESTNRRTNHTDRRVPSERRLCNDRRGYGYFGPAPNSAETIRTLKDLLHESHVRIRALEQAYEDLTKAI